MKRSLRTIQWLAVLASAALLVGISGCSRQPETALRIGTNVWIGSEPLYLARELGYLDPAVVQLVEYPSASEVLRAYRNQAIDGMVISLDELFGLAVDGLQPRIILVVDVSHGADVVVGRPGMKSMQDLKGKSVAVESGALGAFVLSRALTLNGMQASDVNVVHLESNEQPKAFEAGKVDGAVTFDPYRGQFLKMGAATLFDSTQIPGEIVDLVAVRAPVIVLPARLADRTPSRSAIPCRTCPSSRLPEICTLVALLRTTMPMSPPMTRLLLTDSLSPPISSIP